MSSPGPVEVTLEAGRTGPSRRQYAVRRLTLWTALLVVLQVAVGMVVNLYVRVPAHHPGAQPSDYFSGSLRSVVWTIGSGPPALAVHAALGLGVIAMALVLAVRAIINLGGRVAALSVVAAAMAIGAGFNGASFLDFGAALSSLLMSLLALGALACYLVDAHLLGSGPPSR
jgi:hypothetical protein